MMNSALEALIKSAAGTGGPTKQSSRYYSDPIETYTGPDGQDVVYLQRRIIPQPGIYTALQDYVVVEGDRLDNLAAKFLGDPLLFWMICDANGVTDPDELTAQVGRTIHIPIASAVPAGVRNG
jgi:nucleoid-associated protein YgaU